MLDDTVTVRQPKRVRRLEDSQAESVSQHSKDMSVSEDSEGTKVKAEYHRLHVVSAIRNAIPVPLTPDNILSAWRTSHLYPFTTDPPYTREKEAEYQREMIASHGVLVTLNPIQLTDGKKTGLVTRRRINGVVNTPEFMASNKDILAGDLEPEPCEGLSSYHVGGGPVTGLIEASTEDDDVGDYVATIPCTDGKPARLVGTSDAPLLRFP